MSKSPEHPDVSYVVDRRRDFHRYPERGWCEIRTASLIARELDDLGFDVRAGRSVVDPQRMGLPSDEELASEYRRALSQGADEEYAAHVAGGFTGVVATLGGRQPGDVVALRFDIDANSGAESTDSGHWPAVLGFGSTNEGVHHSCGHDGHAAVGLALARLISEQRHLVSGEVRLIFQPAEEGLRGGNSMVAAGVVENVDYFLSAHIGVQVPHTGEVVAGYHHILASTKFDAHFAGRGAHAGISPHVGRNTIQAAAIAVQNLLAIPRHGAGETRVNVGQIIGGEMRNSIPSYTVLRGEVRGETDEILEFLRHRAEEVIQGAARICGVEASVDNVGGAPTASSDDELAQVVSSVAAADQAVSFTHQACDFKASDDVTCFMNAVQANGGKAVYFGVGSNLADAHHTPLFDFDESSLYVAVRLFAGCLRKLGVLQ